MTVEQIVYIIKKIQNIDPSCNIIIEPTSHVGNYGICFFHKIDGINVSINELKDKMFAEGIRDYKFEKKYFDSELSIIVGKS